MTQPKKLIEVAMPIKEISAESVRDKSIRHGHISTLHLWWARRPLPVCRAVVFASLVPDPLDEHCPAAFRVAVEQLLGADPRQGDPYKPYLQIPWTGMTEPMTDNLRNRLQMFIGKFTPEMQGYLSHQKPKPEAKNQLTDYSLIKWDSKNNEIILKKARQLIWVAHNAGRGLDAPTLLAEFEQYYQAIKQAEQALYELPDRHLNDEAAQAKAAALQGAIEAFLDHMPRVFDPFAGGGAIPLEAARLGCRSFGNDINPVAHIIQKGSLEFPQRFGKPITYSQAEFVRLYGEAEFNELAANYKVYHNRQVITVSLPNRLAFDVAFYAKKLLAAAEREIGQYYPSNEKGVKPIAYYWARTATCNNPSCRAEVPLLRGFYLADTKTKQVYLKPIIEGNQISFEVKKGKCEVEGWMTRGNLKCPCCNNVTDVKAIKQQFINGTTHERLLVVIWEGQNGKEYKLPQQIEIEVVKTVPTHIERPSERMPVEYTQALPSCTWGLETWGGMFSPRQIFAMQTLVAKLHDFKAELKPHENEYGKAVVTYLGIWVNRLTPRCNMFGLWNTIGEKIEHVFGRQAIPMVFDYPESNIFATSGGGGLNQLDWITRYIISETNEFHSYCNNASSGNRTQFETKSLTAVITDPPYYDAIAYADLSDFFYVWLKRTLGDVYPLNFATPQTPKSEECTALKHHHNDSKEEAKQHFEAKLLQIFDAIEQQTTDIVSIMFAHQSTEAWTTLCNSILGARMNITGSWAIDTERTSGTKVDKAFLSSSVTVACKPSQRQGIGAYKAVKKAIEQAVAEQVETLYQLGFRGADLLTACFGKAVSEFGQYETVEKADGSTVTVAELLDLAKESAFNALLKGFVGDDFTKFYVGWLQLYGFVETDFDDAAKFSRVGLTINVAELFDERLLIKNGNKQTLATLAERLAEHKNLDGRYLINAVHQAMGLYQSGDRQALVGYVRQVAGQADSPFWRVLTSLGEVLPAGSVDHKQAQGLLTSKDSLLREMRQAATTVSVTQGGLGLG